MVILHSYVSLPEGTRTDSTDLWLQITVVQSLGDSIPIDYPLVMTNIAMGNGMKWPIYRWFTS